MKSAQDAREKELEAKNGEPDNKIMSIDINAEYCVGHAFRFQACRKVTAPYIWQWRVEEVAMAHLRALRAQEDRAHLVPGSLLTMLK